MRDSAAIDGGNISILYIDRMNLKAEVYTGGNV